MAVRDLLRAEQERAASVSKEGSFAIPHYTFGWSGDSACADCSSPLELRRTRKRKIVSLACGRFIAVEREGYCRDHPGLPVVRSRELARLVGPGSSIAWDVVVHVGMAHFLQCRQYEEIQTDLSGRHGVEIPVRTIGHLARKFVACVQAVHEQSIPLLRRDMLRRGGYILPVDGTCEEGSRVLLVCLDSLSGQLLDSRKIASESTLEVRAVLEEVQEKWGTPLAVVHDLRTTLVNAVGEVFAKVPQFVCHYHLAADVGKDILAGHIPALPALADGIPDSTGLSTTSTAEPRTLAGSGVSKAS